MARQYNPIAAPAACALIFVALGGCAARPAPPVVALSPSLTNPAPPGMQWLYGSGEGAASSLQAFRGFTDHALAAARSRPQGGVVLAAGASLTAPRFEACGSKPLAVMLDVDETAIQNLGYEYALASRGKSSDGALLDEWQKAPQRAVASMPGVPEALSAIRAAGITVIFNSNRDNPDAAATAATLAAAGLGPAVPGETLLLRGDVDGKSGKDGRRSFAAQRYCVVAMAGDQLGDFADGFNDKALSISQRRALAFTGPLGALWGKGWYLLSNPVYGPGLRGEIDEVFPAAVRWRDDEGVE